MDNELGILALVQALSTDEGAKGRAADLLALMQQIEAGKKQIEQTRAEAEEMMRRAGEDRASAEAALQAAQHQNTAVSAERDGLANAIRGHQDEVARFNAVRERVEADHATREAAVAAREAKMDEHEQDIANRHAALAEREQKVAEAEAAHADRERAAQAVIDAVAAFHPVQGASA